MKACPDGLGYNYITSKSHHLGPVSDTMWFKEDEHTVYADRVHVASGVDMEVAVRFGPLLKDHGLQECSGTRRWSCAYVAMDDADFERIEGKLMFDPRGYPEVGAHDGRRTATGCPCSRTTKIPTSPSSGRGYPFGPV